jgi:DNA-binding MarR family transcriptional regulator
MKSIKRLADAKLIKIIPAKRKKACNHYEFADCDAFTQIPYSIFEAENLTFNQKAMLVALRQCFDSFKLRSMVNTYTDMAASLGVSYKTVYTQYKELVKKGYIAETTKEYATGNKSLIITLTDKLDWLYKEPTVTNEAIRATPTLLVA